MLAITRPLQASRGVVRVDRLPEIEQIELAGTPGEILDVPLLVLDDARLPVSKLGTPVDFAGLGPLAALSRLASTETGFLPLNAPDYRFDGLLGQVAEAALDASHRYRDHDADAFRSWLRSTGERLGPDAGPSLRAEAAQLPPDRQHALLVPLVYLNHMWRQGSALLPAATGPSVLPPPFAELLEDLTGRIHQLPRINQILLTIHGWRLDGAPVGSPVEYRDVTALHRMRPYFWLDRDNTSEMELYRSFFSVESFGIPMYGWSALLAELRLADDPTYAALALRMLNAALRNVYFQSRRLIPGVSALEFRKVQVTAGWVDDEVTGVASGYQLPFFLLMDALLGTAYSDAGAAAARENNLRFVPRAWQDYFRALYDAQLGEWIGRRGDTEAVEEFAKCGRLFALYRSMHRYLGALVMQGATTTGRSFSGTSENVRIFVREMDALIDDTVEASERVAAASDREAAGEHLTTGN